MIHHLTDGQTDRRAIAYTRYSMLSRVKTKHLHLRLCGMLQLNYGGARLMHGRPLQYFPQPDYTFCALTNITIVA